MAIQIRFDSEGNALRPTLVLANRRGDKLGALATVGSFELTDSFSSASEF